MVIGDHRAGTFQQVARAGVVTQTGPGSHYVAIFGRRKRVDSGPETDEAQKICLNGGDSGLLQHHL